MVGSVFVAVVGIVLGKVVGIHFGIVAICVVVLVQDCQRAMLEIDRDIPGLLVFFGSNV